MSLIAGATAAPTLPANSGQPNPAGQASTDAARDQTPAGVVSDSFQPASGVAGHHFDGVDRIDLIHESLKGKRLISELLSMSDTVRALNASSGGDDNGVLPDDAVKALERFKTQIALTNGDLSSWGKKESALRTYLTSLSNWCAALETSSNGCAKALQRPDGSRAQALADAKAAGKKAVDGAALANKRAWVDLMDDASEYKPTFNPTPGGGFGNVGLLDAKATLANNAPTQYQQEFDQSMASLMTDPTLTPWPKGSTAAKMSIVNSLDEPGICWEGDADGDFSPGGKIAKVMWANIAQLQEASNVPLLKALLDPSLLPNHDVNSEVLFNSLHELSHSIGPHTYTKDGKETAIEDSDPFTTFPGNFLYLDEPRADIAGMWLTRQLIDKGELPPEQYAKNSVAFFDALFSYTKGDPTDFHTKGAWANLNYLLEKGALTFNPATTKWNIDEDKLNQVIPDLLRIWVELERAGNPTKAKAFFDQYAKTDGPVQQSIEATKDITNFDKLNILFDRSQVGLPDSTSFPNA